MSVKIRLRRVGRNNRPFYRVVATDARCSNTGPFLELLGWYDPKKKGDNFSLNQERIDYWRGTGAIPSDTVKSLIRKNKNKPVTEPIPEPAEGTPVEKPVETPVAATPADAS